MTKKLFIFLMSAVMGASVQAEETKGQGLDADWLGIGGRVRLDTTFNESDDYETNFETSAAELIFEALLLEGVRAVIKTELKRVLIEDGIEVGSKDFDFEKFIEEAYIEIDVNKYTGLPVAYIRLGKQSVAFAKSLSMMAIKQDNLLYDILRQKEVIGLTVQLNTDFLKIVDTVAISVFETGKGDLDIADEVGVSIRLKKQITDRIQAKVSAMYKESADAAMDDEFRGAVGFLFDNGDGSWKVWLEGIVFDNNPKFKDSNFGVAIGAGHPVGPGTVVVEYSYLENFAHEIALGYNLPVGKHLTLSPEVRHRMGENGNDDETRFGIRAVVRFKGKPKRPLIKK